MPTKSIPMLFQEQSEYEHAELAREIIWQLCHWVRDPRHRTALHDTLASVRSSDDAQATPLQQVDLIEHLCDQVSIYGNAPKRTALIAALFDHYKKWLLSNMQTGVDANEGGLTYRLFKAIDLGMFQDEHNEQDMECIHVWLSPCLKLGIAGLVDRWPSFFRDHPAPVGCSASSAVAPAVPPPRGREVQAYFETELGQWMRSADRVPELKLALEAASGEYQGRYSRYLFTSRSKELADVNLRYANEPLTAMCQLWAAPKGSWGGSGYISNPSLNVSLLIGVVKSFLDNLDGKLSRGEASLENLPVMLACMCYRDPALIAAVARPMLTRLGMTQIRHHATSTMPALM